MTESLEEVIKKQRLLVGVPNESKVHERSFWQEELKVCIQGYEIAIQFLGANPAIFEDPELNEGSNRVALEDCVVNEAELRVLNDPERILPLISGSASLQKLWNKSPNVLLAIYIAGSELFDQKNFIESCSVFTFLSLLNKNIPSFWIGRGAANEAMENWDKALSDYWRAQSLNQEDVAVYKGLIRIYKRLKDEKSLADCLAIIEKIPGLSQRLHSAKEAIKGDSAL